MHHEARVREGEMSIEARVLASQVDSEAADNLIRDYLPFIKSEIYKFLGRAPIEGQDDELGIAMFAFHEAAMAYKIGRGAFLKLASVAIKHSLIDYKRREKRHMKLISLDSPIGNDEDSPTLAENIADEHNELEIRQERAIAKAEIAHFSDDLRRFGLTLSDIAKSSPKQSRTLTACHSVLAHARENPELLSILTETGKLPIAQLCDLSGVDRKTIERHRRYIVALLLAYTNGFEIIRGHLEHIAVNKGGRSQ